eukprot:4262453-Prymnesium_polylepis.1
MRGYPATHAARSRLRRPITRQQDCRPCCTPSTPAAVGVRIGMVNVWSNPSGFSLNFVVDGGIAATDEKIELESGGILYKSTSSARRRIPCEHHAKGTKGVTTIGCTRRSGQERRRRGAQPEVVREFLCDACGHTPEVARESGGGR